MTTSDPCISGKNYKELGKTQTTTIHTDVFKGISFSIRIPVY
jgi:hypothetical protein